MIWKIQCKIELSVFNKLYIGNSSQIINNNITRLKHRDQGIPIYVFKLLLFKKANNSLYIYIYMHTELQVHDNHLCGFLKEILRAIF